jgi:hypothetical protein
MTDDTLSLRFIDCQTRQVVAANIDDVYVALSYVWGNNREDCIIAPLTVPEPAPAVIEDAMVVVVALGLRFLWVDRYCISQEDESDKRAQIPHMDATYKNAHLTIVAAAGKDSEHGLPGVQSRSRNPHVVEKIEGRTLFTVPGDPCHLVRNRPGWEERGRTRKLFYHLVA